MSNAPVNSKIEVIPTPLPGVLVLQPRLFTDSRGYFLESWNAADFERLGVTQPWVQDNHSHSVRNTVRGLHYQVRFPQAKLCRVVQGAVRDVVLDLRRQSPAFGQVFHVELSADNHRAIYIPRGCAHGFAVLTESADFLYKCDEFYHPEDERTVRWDDPDLAIPWDITVPLLSPKDTTAPRLKDIPASDLPSAS